MVYVIQDRTEDLSETCTVSFQNQFEKLVRLVGFIMKKKGRQCSAKCSAKWAVQVKRSQEACKVKVKVKQSRYRPGVAQRVPGS
jgi:hypothetical protein